MQLSVWLYYTHCFNFYMLPLLSKHQWKNPHVERKTTYFIAKTWGQGSLLFSSKKVYNKLIKLGLGNKIDIFIIQKGHHITICVKKPLKFGYHNENQGTWILSSEEGFLFIILSTIAIMKKDDLSIFANNHL